MGDVVRDLAEGDGVRDPRLDFPFPVSFAFDSPASGESLSEMAVRADAKFSGSDSILPMFFETSILGKEETGGSTYRIESGSVVVSLLCW